MGYCGVEEVIGLANVKQYLEENHYRYQHKQAHEKILNNRAAGMLFLERVEPSLFTFAIFLRHCGLS